MENKLHEIEQSAAANQRRQDLYNLDELNDAMANQQPRANSK